ncbi:MAG: glucoamylase family protein [Phycisphaerales bacterium]
MKSISCAVCLLLFVFAANAGAEFSAADNALLEEITLSSFQYFWKEADVSSGLIRDTSNAEVCSVASLGFGLATLPIGVERKYVSCDDAKNRALNAMRTLKKSNAQYKGVFCHFIDMETGNTTDKGYESIASTIDTALMIAGALVAGEYFGGEVKQLADEIFAQVNWAAYVHPENGQVYMAYDIGKTGKFEKQTWDWYTDETLLIVLLGQAAPNPEYRLASESMTNWKRPVGKYKNGQPFIYSYPGTLFTYMFAHCFYDFKKTGRDPLGVDWFENTRRAVIANRDWCIDHSDRYSSYGENLWGFTAGSSPDGYVVLGNEPRGASENHQGHYGTMHPYGAGMSVPFLPDDSIAALRYMRNLKVDNRAVWQDVKDEGYGFWDGFNIDRKWVSDCVIGIAQGPMLLMIENARTGLIWRLMMQNKDVITGLKRAGFKGNF